ncbi:MAG: hypothetical protein F6K40_01315 [Okeania sp. SIO3I5]|uniref:hypothetical protein n=1 Tax=Okeania sp. SIO3I5 TaxID=2607805 RepID=UPI0013BA6975|nr:hypothetical protein [Okeania sp. SIO3I5]NEQ35023.1 hypothetical protein [Okeania sp. SIO3I5]
MKTLIINSPIEFVLLGPVGSRMSVLAKSEQASVNLIAHYIIEYEKGEKIKYFSSLFLRLSDSPEIHYIKSNSINNLSNANYSDQPSTSDKDDPRKSRMIFCWNGFSNLKDTSFVQDEFSQYTSDIVKALIEEDKDEVEWVIAPIVYRCTKINEKYQNKIRFLRLVLNVIFIVLMITFILSSYELIKHSDFLLPNPPRPTSVPY